VVATCLLNSLAMASGEWAGRGIVVLECLHTGVACRAMQEEAPWRGQLQGWGPKSRVSTKSEVFDVLVAIPLLILHTVLA
jgi:hypothetical protein